MKKPAITIISLCLLFNYSSSIQAQISSEQVIGNAYSYLNHEWTARSSNIWNNSFCGNKLVNTPNWVIIGQNTALPYCWGGNSSISDFENQLDNDKSAGDNNTTTTYGAGPSCAVGVDCSGFVGRCYGLTTKYSTSTLDSSPLFGHYNNSYNSLRAGDFVNKPGSHTRLIVQVNNNGSFNCIEAGQGSNQWKVFPASYTTTDFVNNGYKPQYYTGMIGEALDCSNAISLTCGSTYHGLSSSAISNVNSYGCNSWTETGPERVHTVTTSQVGTLTAEISNFSGDLDVYILGSCDPNDCLGTVLSSSATYENAPAGQYYIVVDADDGSGSSYDLVVTGNCANPQPDLIVVNQFVSNTTVEAGSNITAYCAENNSGDATAAANIVTLYLSPNAVLTPGANGDAYIDFINFPSLTPNSSSLTRSKSIQIPNGTAPGNYYLFYWADGGNVVAESDEENNFASVQITVTASTQTYIVNTSSNPAAGGTTSGGGVYSSGQHATVIATSNDGYTFVNWTEDGNYITSNASHSFGVQANRNLVANFSTCNYTLDHYSTSAIASATSGAFWVFTASDCNWTATTSGCAGMITLTNPLGTGNGLVTFDISENLSPSQRTCTITVEGNTYTVVQEGYVAPCGVTPSDPLNCNAIINGSIVIYVSWNGNSTNVSDFAVERSLSATGPFSTIAYTGTTFHYFDNNVIAGVTYYYRVKACCNSNCSNYSNVASEQACTYGTASTGIIASTTDLCAGESVTLTVDGGSLGTGAEWVWRANQCNTGPIVGTGRTITIVPTDNTAYVVKGEGGCSYGFIGCSVIILSVDELPTASTISADGPTTFCEGESVVLSGNNGGTWSNGATTPSITVTESGDYFVINSNGCGSVLSNHILVTVNPAGSPDCALSGLTVSGDLDFGTVPRGSVANMPVFLYNNTSSPITINDISVSPTGAFDALMENGNTVLPNNPLPISILFSPTDLVTYNATFTIASDAPNGEVTFTATGRGGVDFPPCNVGCNDDINVTLKADCSAPVTPDMLLEGYECASVGLYPDDFEITIPDDDESDSDLNGVGEFIYEIKLNSSAQNALPSNHPLKNWPGCWGYITGEDKIPPAPICVNNPTVELIPVPPNTDADGDWDFDNGAVEIAAADLLASIGPDCSEPLTFSVHQVGEIPSPTNSSIILTCDDPEEVLVYVYAWDNAYNPTTVQPDGAIGGPDYGFCVTTILKPDNPTLCAGDPPNCFVDCNNDINVTLNAQCRAPITPDMLLDGYECLFTVYGMVESDFLLYILGDDPDEGPEPTPDDYLSDRGQFVYEVQLSEAGITKVGNWPGPHPLDEWPGCSGYITGEDKTAPGVQDPGDELIVPADPASCSALFTIPPVEYTDNCSDNVMISIRIFKTTLAPVPVTVELLDDFSVGQTITLDVGARYEIEYTLSDEPGRQANPVSLEVLPVDRTAPTIEASNDNPFPSVDNDCTASLSIPVEIDDLCVTEGVEVEIFLLPDPVTGLPSTMDLQDPDIAALVEFTLGGVQPNFTLNGRFPLGNHQFEIHAADNSGNGATTFVPFYIFDAKVPAPTCVNNPTVELIPVPPNTDADGDGDFDNGAVEIAAADLLASVGPDCSEPLTFSVHQVGEIPSPTNSSIILTCDDPEEVLVYVYAWDNAYNPTTVQPDGAIGGPNYGFCVTTILKPDNPTLCAENPPNCIVYCLDDINVTLKADCSAPVTPDMLLEGYECVLQTFDGTSVTADDFEITIRDDDESDSDLNGVGEFIYEIKLNSSAQNALSSNHPLKNWPGCSGYITGEDKMPPAPVCVNNPTVELIPVAPNTDADGDGDFDNGAVEIAAADLLASVGPDCSEPLTYSVNLVGEVPSQARSSIILTCDDPETVLVEVYAWDNAYNPRTVQPDGAIGGPNYRFCVTTILKPDNPTLCAGAPNAGVANAGPDQTVLVGETVQLNGSGSFDPGGDPLTYQWQFVSRPLESAALLSGAAMIDPTFVPDIAGTYIVELVVNDGLHNSFPDQVTITVTLPPEETVVELIDGIVDLVAGEELTGDLAKSLISKLTKIILRIGQGNFADATSKLQAFIKEVEALIADGALSEAEGNPLIEQAKMVMDQLIEGMFPVVESPPSGSSRAGISEILALLQDLARASGQDVSLAAASPDEISALIALYNATDGRNWTNNTNWLNGMDPCDFAAPWFGITCDQIGRVTEVDLAMNGLTGFIPADIGNLVHLVSFDLFGNQIGGAIPTALGNLVSLQYLDLFHNQLNDVIPPELGNLVALQYLDLSGNQLSGGIPLTLGNLTGLRVLDLFENELTGAIPPELGDLVNLKLLDLSSNQLNGSIPAELGNLSSLELLDLFDNQLSGHIPAALGNLSRLKQILLSRNQLDGDIPPELGNLMELQLLDLSRNQLQGAIPSELASLSQLKQLLLFGNQLRGSIPAELGNLPQLVQLLLSGNELDGNIPVDLGRLSNLRQLALSDNRLTGDIPVTLRGLSSLLQLGLSGNQLSGSIPSTLGDLPDLRTLYLQDNQLSGCFPASLRNLCGLGFAASATPYGYNLTNNPGLPWQGDFQRFCGGEEQTGASCDDGDPATENDVITADCGCVGTAVHLLVRPVVYLQGPYDPSTGLMHDNLRTGPGLPLTEPYTALDYIHAGGGGENASESVYDVGGPEAIVDWVFLELRDRSDPTMILATRSALLQRDGDVVDADGQSPVIFFNMPADDYYLAVKHRNHLGAMTVAPIPLSPTPAVVDFTTDLGQVAGGANGIATLEDGKLGLYSGDFNHNGQIQNTDYVEMVQTLGTAGYQPGDFDLNGQVQNTDLQLKLVPNIGRGAAFPD